jgi:hypothetical protein
LRGPLFLKGMGRFRPCHGSYELCKNETLQH